VGPATRCSDMHRIQTLIGTKNRCSMNRQSATLQRILTDMAYNREEFKNKVEEKVGGALLVVSQFTLYGDARRGKRPSFDAAAPPEQARELYEYFVERVRGAGLRCETGRFQETMQVELVNEGPVTILLDSAKGF